MYRDIKNIYCDWKRGVVVLISWKSNLTTVYAILRELILLRIFSYNHKNNFKASWTGGDMHINRHRLMMKIFVKWADSKFNSNSILGKDGKLYSDKILSFNLLFFLHKSQIGCNIWQNWLCKDPMEDVGTALSFTLTNMFFL